MPRITNLKTNLPPPAALSTHQRRSQITATKDMLTIKLEKNEVTPHLRSLLAQAATNGPLANVLGRAGANVLKNYFRERNKTGNKLGGRRTNFWSAVAMSVQSPRSVGGNIVISITHPAIAQKVYGGTITAKKAKNLAIPIDARAHGKSPRVFSHLEFLMTKSGTRLLGLKEGNGIIWLYVLKPSVSQKADPHALPKNAEVEAALDKAADIFFRRFKKST